MDFRQRQSIYAFHLVQSCGVVSGVMCADIPACFDNKILDCILKLYSNQHQPYLAK